jgi:DNA-binding CsgD family transcriptional regulator
MTDCQLIVIAALPGEAEGASYTFDTPAVGGRGDDCDIRLSHPLVSRRHVELSCTGEGDVVIRDLGSTNGTIAGDEVLRSTGVARRGPIEIQVGPYTLSVTTARAANEATILAPRPGRGAPVPGLERRPGDPLPDGLTEREAEVLRLVARGRSNPDIAEELVLSVNTVTRHVSNIFDKTTSANRVELARYAFQRGLVD